MKRPNLKPLLKHIKDFSLKDHIPRKPESIWFLLLAVFVAINMFSFSWSVTTFLQANDVEEIYLIEDISGGGDTINRSELERLIEELNERMFVFDSLTEVVVQPIVLDGDEEGEDAEEEEIEDAEDAEEGETEDIADQEQ